LELLEKASLLVVPHSMGKMSEIVVYLRATVLVRLDFILLPIYHMKIEMLIFT
jgi:hypothetical protein